MPLCRILVDHSRDRGKALAADNKMLIQIDTEGHIQGPVGEDEIRIFDLGTILNINSRPEIRITVDRRFLGDIPEIVAILVQQL